MTKRSLKSLTLAASVGAATLLAQPTVAQTNFTDATGDILNTASILDIASVEVSNNAFDLIFKITVVGDPVDTDWGKYMIGFDTVPGGDTLGNGWGRPIAMSQGMDYWVGSWVDSGNGAELYQYTAAWANIGAPGVSKTTNSITLNVPFLNMGLGVGSTFQFDVFSSGGGGGDGAIDSLANPNQTIANWGDFYDSSTNLANPPKSYTIVASADPTNKVTFTVDMQVPIALFDADFSDPNGFDTNSDIVYVRGNFNGWTASPEFALIQVGPTLFSNTVDVVAAAGSTISYKFFGANFPGEERTLLLCNGVRTLEITSPTLTAPAAFWGDRQLSDPTNAITFAVDMSLQEAAGRFTNGLNNVYARGNFNDFDLSFMLTNNPVAADSNVYRGVLDIPAPLGACGYEYKFFTDSPSMPNTGWESPLSTGGNNRGFAINSTNQVLPTVFWNDLTPCEALDAETQVTFSIDMTGATGTDATVYDGTQTIYVNGDFAGWWSWGAPGPTNYALTKVGATDVHTITLPISAGNAFRLVYKYSIGGPDNEAGFGADHVRYIRTAAGVTNYTLPQDLWINTNPLAPRVEDEIGGLAAKPSTPGNVTLEWIGLPCTAMEGATNVTGPWTPLFEARGVASTNMPVAGDQMYFRLAR